MSFLARILGSSRERQTRTCGGCVHFDRDGTCHHPQAEWGWGLLDSWDIRLHSPQNRWPKKEPWEWCGFWRPGSGGAP